MHYTEMQRKAADNLAKGMDIKHALLDAGYSENVARQGKAAISERVWKLLGRKSRDLIELGKALPNDAKEALIMGRLAKNIADGKDLGVQSCKLMGSHKELSIFTPDTQIGVIALVAPTEIHEKKDQMLAELDNKG